MALFNWHLDFAMDFLPPFFALHHLFAREDDDASNTLQLSPVIRSWVRLLLSRAF